MTDRGNQCTARLLLSPPILFSCITGLSPSLPIQPLWFAAWLILSLAFHPSPPSVHTSLYLTIHSLNSTSLRLHFTVIYHFGCCSLQCVYHPQDMFPATLSCTCIFFLNDSDYKICTLRAILISDPSQLWDSLKYTMLISVCFLSYDVGMLMRYWSHVRELIVVICLEQ